MDDRIERVWISQEVQEQIFTEALQRPELETGGIVLGYWGCPTGEPVITAMIGPGPKAVHKARSFRPDVAFHQAASLEAFEQSNGRTVYLGDWHTHPGGPDLLSRRDLRTLGRISRSAMAQLPTPLMLIVAGPPYRMTTWIAAGPLRRLWPSFAGVRPLTMAIYSG